MYNFGEIVNNVAVLVQRSGDDDYKTEIKTWVNLSLMTLYNHYDYFIELKGEKDITTVDGTALYYMPSDFEKPIRMYDITNDKKISINNEYEYFDANIANIADSNEADPDAMYFKEVVGVKRQVSTSGDTVQAKSSASESGNPKVRVEGYLDSDLNVIGYEEITVTGTSNVAGTTTFYKILNVSKDEDTTGYITLSDSSANVLSLIGPTERVVRHKAYRLGRIPDDSTTSIRTLYKKRFRKLVDDEDYPFIEADDYLTYSSAALALQQSKDAVERAVLMEKKASSAFNGIMLNQSTKLGPDYQQKLVSSTSQAHRA